MWLSRPLRDVAFDRLTGSTTHSMEEAEQLAGRVGILMAGHLPAPGSPSEPMKETGTSHLEDTFLHLVKGKSDEAVGPCRSCDVGNPAESPDVCIWADPPTDTARIDDTHSVQYPRAAV